MTDELARPPIPQGVWYSAGSDNFYSVAYSVANRVGMGMAFWQHWRGRKDEFPTDCGRCADDQDCPRRGCMYQVQSAVPPAISSVGPSTLEVVARTLFEARAASFAPEPHWDQEPNSLRAECFDDALDVVKALAAGQPVETKLLETKLPCDVHLPPNTYIRKGCEISTLMTAIRQREGRSDADTTFQRDDEIPAFLRRQPPRKAG